MTPKFDEDEGPPPPCAAEEGEEVALGGSDFGGLGSKNEDVIPPNEPNALVRSPRSNVPSPPTDEDPVVEELVCGDSIDDVPPRGGEVTLLVDDPLGGDITLVGGVTEECLCC